MKKRFHALLAVAAMMLIAGFFASHADAATITRTFANQPRTTTVFDFGQQVPLPSVLITPHWCWKDGNTSGCFSETRKVAVGQSGLIFSAFKMDGGAGIAGPSCTFYTENPNAFDYCMDIVSSAWDGQRLKLEWEGMTDRYLNDHAQFGGVPLTTISVTTEGDSGFVQYYYGNPQYSQFFGTMSPGIGNTPLGTANPPYQVVFPQTGIGNAPAVIGPQPIQPNPQVLGATTMTQPFQTTTVTSPAGSGAIIQFSKSVRNTLTKEQFFAASTEAQGLDILEFQIRVRNIGTQAAQVVTVKDFLPPELFYTKGSTKINGTPISIGEIVDGIMLGSVNPGEEKTVTFQAVVFFGVAPKTITNQVMVSADSASQVGTAHIVIKSRGKVLGAGTVVTGPTDTVLWTLLLGFLGAVGLYLLLFKYRFRGKTLASISADYRLSSLVAELRKKEKHSDIT